MNKGEGSADTAGVHFPIQSLVGQIENVTGTVVAVHAVHDAPFSLGDKFRLGRIPLGFEDGERTVGIAMADPRDDLAFFIGRNISDQAQMSAVNTLPLSVKVLASDMQQEHSLCG